MLTQAKQFLACTVTQSWRNKKFIRQPFSGLNQEIGMLWEINKDDTSLIFKSVRFPKLRYSSKYFAQTYRDRYLRGTPTLRPENSVNIWSLLWLSRRLKCLYCTEQTSIYVSTFPSTLTADWVENHDISICFSANAFVGLCHAPP